MLDTKKFVRRPFSVIAVEVTETNIDEVASWCGGLKRTSAGEGGRGQQTYIKVNVKRPLNERQTKAYVGDWVVSTTDKSVQGFKVYTPNAFVRSYEETMNDIVDTLERMDNREKREDRYEEEGGFAEELQLADKQLN